MKNYPVLCFQLFLILGIISLPYCKEPEKEMVVSTGEASNLKTNSADVDGQIVDLGDGAFEYGHCYAKIPNPTINSLKTQFGIPAGNIAFKSQLLNLEAGTTYYVKAYLSNGERTVYGKEVYFSTLPGSVPSVSTTAVTLVTSTSASSGGIVSSAGGTNVTARGVCWNIVTSPTISNAKTVDNSGLGSFVSSLTGLKSDTKYYVRAYATNSEGTAYGNELQFTTSLPSDKDGNLYHTVVIGSQVWMKENLKTTKFSDGEGIPLVTDDNDWSQLTSPGYCWNNNDISYKNDYGALYNFYTVSNGKLCPSGWHVPTDEEWTILTDFLGGSAVAGGKLKEAGTSHWTAPNTGADNSSGFTALGGGIRYNDYDFFGVDTIGVWFTATPRDGSSAWGRITICDTALIERDYFKLNYGFSVRCLRDE